MTQTKVALRGGRPMMTLKLS